MTPEDIAGYIDNLRGRFAELETAMADPGLYARTAECRQVTQEHRKLESLFNRFDAWTGALNELAENREMLTVEEDADLRELIESDIAVLEEKAAGSNPKSSFPCFRPIPTTRGTSSSKSNPPPAETRRRSSRGNSSAPTRTMRKSRGGSSKSSTRATPTSAESRTSPFPSRGMKSIRG